MVHPLVHAPVILYHSLSTRVYSEELSKLHVIEMISLVKQANLIGIT